MDIATVDIQHGLFRPDNTSQTASFEVALELSANHLGLKLVGLEFGFGRKMGAGKSFVCYLPASIFLPIKNETEGVFLLKQPGDPYYLLISEP